MKQPKRVTLVNRGFDRYESSNWSQARTVRGVKMRPAFRFMFQDATWGETQRRTLLSFDLGSDVGVDDITISRKLTAADIKLLLNVVNKYIKLRLTRTRRLEILNLINKFLDPYETI